MNLRRAIYAILITGALIGSLFPMANAVAAPNVELLNPSGYSGEQSPQWIVSSREDGTDNTYDLVAWVGDAPTNPFVEFEILGVQNVTAQATLNGTAVGSDTWEAEFAIPDTFTDGQYEVRAILYSNFTGPNTGQEVDTVERVVTINSGTPPPAANTVEITAPANGAGVGFYTPPGKQAVAHVSGTTSDQAVQTRILFSTSAPGSNPEWTQCGGAAVASRQFAARCTLPEGVPPSSVRAIAAVANNTPPPGTPVAAADESGDAHRVFPYTARATTVRYDSTFTPQPNTCQAVTGTVLDQNGVPIPTANVDVHGQGPNDQLRFATQRGVNSGFQTPNDGHGATEPTVQCEQTDAMGTQAEHSVPGGADIKHIESTGGTTAAGQFTFVLHSGTIGGTLATMWVDDDDDDSRDLNEAAGTARIGWGQSPPPPQQELVLEPGASTATVGSCERIVVAARQDGAPILSANVDIHIEGPTGVSFCSTGDSSTRSPDMGGHTGDSDGGDTRHNEGETNAQGELVFGVSSPIEGATEIAVWLDATDDDVQAENEPSTAGQVSWQPVGDRSISIRSSRKAVRRGGRVRIFGSIEAAETCADGQRVRLMAKPARGGRFRAIANRTTDSEGDYSFRVRVRRTRRYRAVAPSSGVCEFARSRIITVRRR